MNEQDVDSIKDLARFHYNQYLPNGARSKACQVSQIAHAQGIAILGITTSEVLQFSAVAIELRNGQQYIVYNRAQPEDEQALCIGHEIFHLVAEHPSGIDPEREAAADLYADTLLGLLE